MMYASDETALPDACGDPAGTADCRLVVDCQAIRRNLAALQSKTKSRIMAVVKHDGYGLDLLQYARLLTSSGVEELAVGTYAEAIALRRGGIGAPVLLLTPLVSAGAAAELLRKGVMLTVGSAEQADIVQRAAAETGIRPKVHIKIDTGLGRYGFEPESIDMVPVAVDGMEVRGTFTHFSSPYVSKKTTGRQYSAFVRATEHLHALGVNTGALHCCASGGLLNYPEMHMDLVRTGSALIGRVPEAQKHGLAPAVFLEAPVLSIREAARGARLGYRGAVKIGRSRRVGILNAAGACAALAAGQRAEVNGSPARILGPLGLGALALDLTGVPCAVGDVAKLEINPLRCAGFLQKIYENGGDN